MRLHWAVRGSRERKHQDRTPEAVTRNARPTHRRSAYSTRALEGLRMAFTKASVSVLAMGHRMLSCVPGLTGGPLNGSNWCCWDPIGTHNDWIQRYSSERNRTIIQLKQAIALGQQVTLSTVQFC